MLRACRRLLREGGRTAFLTIVVAPDLSPHRHRRAVRAGPRAVRSTRPVDELMVAAGYEEVASRDMTAEFLETALAWADEFDRHETELRGLIGPEWDERQQDRKRMIAGIEEGLLQRLLVTATA